MQKQIFLSVAIATMAGASLLGGQTPAIAQPINLTLMNQTSDALEEFYVTPAAIDISGIERLQNRLVAPGDSVLLALDISECLYDVRGVFSNGAEVLDYGIDLCALETGTYTFFDPDNERQDLRVFNGTTENLVEFQIKGQNTQNTDTVENAGLEAYLAWLENLTERFPELREQLEAMLGELDDLDNVGSYSFELSRSSRIQQSLTGEYVIQPQEEVLIATDIMNADCQDIQFYDITAIFEGPEGRREETQDGVDLCKQDTITFGEPQQGESRTITVQNNTDPESAPGLVLWELYVTPPNTDNWGYDQLGTDVIDQGVVGRVSLLDTTPDCLYDVRAVFVEPESSQALEPVDWLGVNLCELNHQALIYGLDPVADQDEESVAIAPHHHPIPSSQPLKQYNHWLKQHPWKAATKQITRRKRQACLSSASSRVCQPIGKNSSSSSQSPWWQRLFRRP